MMLKLRRANYINLLVRSVCSQKSGNPLNH